MVAWFGSAIGIYATYVWDSIMTVAGPETKFAYWLDARDKKRNNGWIALW